MASGIGKFFGALLGSSEPEVAKTKTNGPRNEPALRGAKAAPPMTPAREKLIREAMKITASKQHVLDELDPGVREKLVREAFDKLGAAAGVKSSPKGRSS